MPNISVIVPVYKVEAYLDRCVQSILNQTYKDFELYLVDDGSPDNCGAMCDAWMEKDSRIRVIHQKNAGLSAARNAAIDKVFSDSDSQWLTFIDSDDWIHSRMLEWMLCAAQQNKSSICVCGYDMTTGEDPWAGDIVPEPEIWTAADFYQQKFVNATIACGKLYSRNIFQSVRYPLGKIHEDEFVTYRLLFEAAEITYLPLPLYAYYVNPGSITKTDWSPRRLHAWDAYEQQIDFFDRQGMEELVKFRYREYIDSVMVNMKSAEKAPEQYHEEIRYMEKRIRKVIRRAWKRGYIEFWFDYDMLHRFYPLLTRVYRLYLEMRK